MKKIKKPVSALLTMAMAASILLPGAAAFAATSNTVMSVPSVEDDGTAVLGELYIEEETSNAFSLTEQSFIVTLPSGVKYDTTRTGVLDSAYWSDFIDDGSGVITGLSMAANKRSLTVKFQGQTSASGSAEENFTLLFPVEFDGFAGGDVKITVDAMDSRITGGEYIIARAGSAGTVATALSVETIGEGSNQEAGVIRITETAQGALKEGEEIILTLPEDFTWNKSSMALAQGNVVALGGFASDVIDEVRFDDEDKKLKIKLKGTDSSKALSSGQRGIIEITPYLDVDSDADYGDVEVDIEGNDVDDATLTIAKFADFGASVTAKTVEEVLAGKAGEELGKLVIEESIAGSLVKNRNITIELPENVRVENASDVKLTRKSGTDIDNGFTLKNNNKIEIAIDETSTSAVEYEVHFKKVNLAADVTGDIAVKIAGRAGLEEQEVVIGKAIAPVTAEATKKAEVKLGMQAQPVGDIIIKEAKKGAIEDDNDTNQKGKLILEAPEGVKFASTPKVEVTEGNTGIDTVKRAGDDRTVEILIDSESTKPSSIKVSDLKLTIDRTVPVGDVVVKVKGDAIAETYEDYEIVNEKADFSASTVAKVALAQVINPAPETGTASFSINSTVYTANGAMKVMDAAPYIKDGRTFVPVRYLALALGVTEDNIQFENGVVTLTKGDVVLKLTIGDKNLDNNDTVTAMDVAPEVVNGRTMLPARFVAEAFGAQVGFANGNVVISY